MLKLLLPLLALAGCGGSGGSDHESAPPASPVVTLSEPDAPADLYFNFHDSIDVVVSNAGPGSAYAQVFVTDNGDSVTGPVVPTLDAGQSFTWSLPIWAAIDADATHEFVLTCPSLGWSRTVTIHYHGMSGG